MIAWDSIVAQLPAGERSPSMVKERWTRVLKARLLEKEMDPEGYFFDFSKKILLANPNKLLKDLITFDKDHIPEATVAKVTPLMDLPEMAADRITAVSQALAPVRIWIVAMLKYHETLKVVDPLREQARTMGEKLAVV